MWAVWSLLYSVQAPRDSASQLPMNRVPMRRPSEEPFRDLRGLGTAGGCPAHPLRLVGPALLGCLSLLLTPFERLGPHSHVGLCHGQSVLASLDGAHHLGRGLLLLLDVRLESGQCALDLLEGLLTLSDAVLDSLDGASALLEVAFAGREGGRGVIRVG